MYSRKHRKQKWWPLFCRSQIVVTAAGAGREGAPSHRGTPRVHEEGPGVAAPRAWEAGDSVRRKRWRPTAGLACQPRERRPAASLPPGGTLPGDLGALAALTLRGLTSHLGMQHVISVAFDSQWSQRTQRKPGFMCFLSSRVLGGP